MFSQRNTCQVFQIKYIIRAFIPRIYFEIIMINRSARIAVARTRQQQNQLQNALIPFDVAELTGVCLNFATAKALDHTFEIITDDEGQYHLFTFGSFNYPIANTLFSPVDDRDQCDEIFKQFNIMVRLLRGGGWEASCIKTTDALLNKRVHFKSKGSTYAEAGLRCFVASYFGARVKIPSLLSYAEYIPSIPIRQESLDQFSETMS